MSSPRVSKVSIGADIEVFLQNKETKEITSAEGIIKGTKEMPFLFKEGDPFFATSLDNVMAEFCIPPASNKQEFYNYIQEAIKYIQNTVADKNLTVKISPAERIAEKYLQTENALLFGCEPDMNAWLFGMPNPKPSAITNLRSCGGHIHIGYENPNDFLSMEIVRAMDIHIGLPSVIMEPDNERKTLYGKAGAFRWKAYGAEYRTVSNYYISSPQLINWAYENTHQAIDFVNRSVEINEKEAEAVQLAINTADKQLASTLCSYFSVKIAA